MASYQEETNLALGIVGGHYFESTDLEKISSISYNALYTFNNQLMIAINPRIYSKNKKIYIYADLNFKHYPNFYYGIGDVKTDIAAPYTSNLEYFNVQPQYYIGKSWLVGGNVTVRAEKLDYPDDTRNCLPSIYNKYGATGWSPYFMLGVGGVLTYNTRDNYFYPSKGIFSKITLLYYPKLIGSNYNVGFVNFDFRQYLPIYKGQIFAYQLMAECVSGKEIPFQLLPTFGGCDKMRGFLEGVYKDNLLLMAQTEYRFPIYKRFKGGLFCSIGDVFNTNNMKYDRLKIGYGGGLRYRLNDARLHLRLDYGITNYKETGFYITATEAF